MAQNLADFVVLLIKIIFYTVIWNIVLFTLGRLALLLITAWRYPRGRALESHHGRISAMGMLILASTWMAIAVHNNLSVASI